jgi:1,4-alpha-glucan branching enzyme
MIATIEPDPISSGQRTFETKPAPLASAPGQQPCASPEVLIEASALPVQEQRGVAHLFGVRPSSQGVLFVQPAGSAQLICVAGEFNFWSPTATPMRRNDQLGVFEAIIPLGPGTYQYRLVIDGEWVADPYNEQVELNSYGEPNSVVRVGTAHAMS